MAKAKKKDILDEGINTEVEQETTTVEKESEVKAIKKVKKEDELTLLFGHGGWCEKLQTSYKPGIYKCKNEIEYEALKPFALKNK